MQVFNVFYLSSLDCIVFGDRLDVECKDTKE